MRVSMSQDTASVAHVNFGMAYQHAQLPVQQWWGDRGAQWATAPTIWFVSMILSSPIVSEEYIQPMATVQTLRSLHIGRESSAKQMEQKHRTQQGSEPTEGKNEPTICDGKL